MQTFFVTFQAAILSILLGTTLLAGQPTFAKAANKKGAKVSEQNALPSSTLSTDINFDALTVHGRHQSPFGVTSVVEAEKETPTLIDYRKSFADRMDQASQGR